MNEKELKEKRNELQAEMEEILNKAKVENRAMNDEEIKSFDDVEKEIKKALKLKKGLPNVKKTAKKHGKSTMPKSYWMPVKMQGLHKRNLPNV